VDSDKLHERFIHHPPANQHVIDAHEFTRVNFEELAHKMNATLPDCSEKDKALDALDLAAMYSNAAIARTQLRNF